MSDHAFADQRRAAILALLDRDTSVRVADLASELDVSTVTIRSDLDVLERAGKLRRTHGGAVALGRSVTVSVQDRRVNVNAEAKRAIAREAASWVKDGQSILLDSGTTALEVARALVDREGITVVTADLTVADLIDKALPGVEAVLLGGVVRKGHRYVTGPVTLAALGMLHADWAFICPTAMVPGRGFMTNFAPMAEVKSAMLDSATRRAALADVTKVGASGLVRFAGAEDVDLLLCDADPGADLRGYLSEKNCELKVVAT